jgi:hypothetical protein
MERVNKLPLGPASYGPQGPDLALGILDSVDVAALEARMSFYDLPMRRARMLDDPPMALGGWILTGIVDEWTTVEEADRPGYRQIARLRWMTAGGVVEPEHRRGDFDYLEFLGRRDVGPQGFAGVSGGGLWLVLPEIGEDSEQRIETPFLLESRSTKH